jgi:hypothetical protein
MGEEMRRADWQNRLTDYLRERHRLPFEYGKWDCALFAAGAVKAMTGKDPMRGLRGYKSLTAGLRKAKAKGHADHVAAVAAMFAEVPPSMAAPGDIAIVDGGKSIGIVQGASIYVITESGLGLVPLTAAERAFRV